jgi:O-methyltransferase involved in polyketide biosynthesis
MEYEKEHSLIKDKYAYEIVQKLEYDFGAVFKQLPMPIMINSAIRAYHLDSALMKVIGEYPDATIINIGAGLDTILAPVSSEHYFGLIS